MKVAQETTAQDIAAAVVQLARRASTEIAPHDERTLAELQQHLPPGTSVYVAHTPKASLEDVLRVAAEAQSLGWTAWPHLVARRLPSERALRDALSELRARGIAQALLVAGDLERPVGPFSSTLEVLGTGALSEAGFRRIGVAGHPEGHRSVAPSELLASLRCKQEFCSRTDIAVHIVTQFGFDLEAVRLWAGQLRAEGVSLPVHVGIAGPTPLAKLIKFAMQCGVRHSMSALAGNLSVFSRFASPTRAPDELLLGLAQGHVAGEGSLLAQPHFFSFGGALSTAAWLRALMQGEFELQPGSRSLLVRH